MRLEEQLHRMEQDFQLRAMSTFTQFNYLRAVRKYSEYFQKPPDQITEDQLRDYFIYLKNVKKFSRKPRHRHGARTGWCISSLSAAARRC